MVHKSAGYATNLSHVSRRLPNLTLFKNTVKNVAISSKGFPIILFFNFTPQVFCLCVVTRRAAQFAASLIEIYANQSSKRLSVCFAPSRKTHLGVGDGALFDFRERSILLERGRGAECWGAK
jgi:hypothetical protein